MNVAFPRRLFFRLSICDWSENGSKSSFGAFFLKLAAEGVAEKVSLHLSLPFHLPFNNGRPHTETSSPVAIAQSQSGLFVSAHSE